jgi:toxin ParE1/3/4
MSYHVFITDAAADDINSLYKYIFLHDSSEKANNVLEKLEKALESLSAFPDRGAYPKELAAIGIREYRETYFKPYRIIYKTLGKKVFVYLVADGRRNLQLLLERRLLIK